MVAVISGNGLGLFNSSFNTLGKKGAQGNANFGQAQLQNYVNIADGNLIIRQLDQNLTAIGKDIQSIQTYNSKGVLSGDAQWGGEWSRRLSLVGDLNTAGSKILIIAEDGHHITFNYSSANTYISTEGDGAYDKLSMNGNTWTITDGKTLASEVYEYNPSLKTGRLVAVKDNNGTNLAYSYDSLDRLISIKDLNSTSLNELIYNYDGTSNRVKRIDAKANGITNQNVYYEYDSLNRLSKVITDLTPNDNSIADQKVYSTNYSYELNSSRIASITQSDGTSVQFSYELDSVTNSYRVKTVRDSQGLTTFTYAANKTTVENSLKEIWEYSYDANQQLISIKNANAEVSSFSYDSQGNVTSIVDNEGNKLTYRYDSNGNLIEEYNHLGKAVKYSYINNSQLATITEFNALATKDANSNWILPTGDSSNTNSVYDSAMRLRFVISAEGGVVEYSYNSQGQLIAKANYQNKYTVASGTAFATLETWSKKNVRNQLSSYEYDVLGNLKREINYSSINKTVDAAGLVNNQGVFEDATQLIDYVYDPRGLLLQKIIRHGADRQTAAATAAQTIQSFTYDGLGRVLTEVSAAGTTTYSYAVGKITVINAANLVTTQSFDDYGRLLNIVQSATNQLSRTTSYTYDEAGRLVYSKQPTGNEQFNFYDKKGRLVGVADSSGLLIEYVYNKNDLQTKEIRYANAVNSTGWLVNNSVAKKRIEEIRPAVNSFDRVIEKSYDSSSQLKSVKQANGILTEYNYDNFGNVIQTKTGDRISRYFYNKDNQQVGALDAEGYLTETIYNAVGQKVQVNRYSKLTTESLRAAGTLAQLKPTGADNVTRSTLFFYNAQNKLIGSIDEKNFIIAYIYDEKNNTVTTRQYSAAATITANMNTVWADFIALIPASNSYQESIKYYDNQGRLTKLSDTRQGITTYGYDNAGRVITEILATGSTNERRVFTRYNVFDDVTHVLAGEVALEIKSGMTAAQVDQVYEQYAIKSYYDAAGRKTQVLNAVGQLTTFYYDKSGRLTHSINAEGNVVETSYTLFDEVKTTTQYMNSLSKTDEKVTDLAGAAIPVAFTNAVGVGKRLKGGELTTTLTSLIAGIKNASKDKIEKFEYDKLGNISKKTDAESNSVDFLYNQYGELDTETRQVTFNGVKKPVQAVYTYSKRGELKSVVTDQGGLNQSTSKEYDAFGRVIKEIDAKGNITSYDYSADQGRSIQVKSANNSLTKTTYDVWNRVLTVNSNNNISSYSYDDKARTLTVKSPEGLQTITRYNEFGDVIEITAANNGKTIYLYNKDGQKTKETNAASASTSYVYDKNTGLLKESTNALGLKTEYIYDDANRVQSQIVTISATEKVETRYRYDGQGQRLEVIEAYGTVNQRSTQYNYDKAGRLTSVVQDATGIKATTTYAYDETGREIRVLDKGVTTVYSYDALGRRLSEIKDPTGEALKIEYRYDLNGNLTRKIDQAGNSSWYIYDNMNRLIYTVNSLGETVGSVYDVNGQMVAQYRYTALQNVVTWAVKDSAILADITLSKTATVSTRFVYNKDGLEIFSVDAEGSVVEKQYNELGKVANIISYDKAINLADENLTQEGIRAALQTVSAGSRTESYYYDALGRILYSIDAAGYVKLNDYDASNNIIRIWNFRPVTTLSRSSTLAQFDAIYKAATVPSFTVQYMYYDKLGRKIYDLDKNSVLTRYSYDEFGNLVGKKETTISHVALLDLLRTKDENGAFNSPRPASTPENYDAGLKLLTDIQFRETNYYYDKLGRVKYIIDALGYVTRFNHNALNNVVDTVKYYDATSLSRSSTLEQLNTVYLPLTASLYTVTGAIYSVTGRKVLEFNEMSFFTYYSYDALGNVIGKKESTLTVGELLDLLRTKDANGNLTARPATTLANINQAILLVPAAQLRETQYYYDKVGRLTYDINALGYVNNYRYDALGQLISSKQSNFTTDSILDLLRTKDASGNFTTPRPELNADNLEKAFKLVPIANYKENNSYYDKDGRLNYSIDAMSYVTRYSYDAYDNVISIIRFKAATTLSRSSTLAQLDVAFKTVITLPDHTMIQYGYDTLNRKVKETDAEGFSVETGYDAFGNTIWVKDKLGNKGYFYYDALNRNTFKIDAEGYITFYYYDVFGNQTAERKYYQRVNGLDKIIADNGLINNVRMLATASEVAPTNQPYLDYNVYYDETSYQYDKLNRKTKISDILSNYEEYTYKNGLTQPATYRNKLGGIYSYTYDKMGYLIQEILPELSNGKQVTNIYEYDAFGNKIKMIEAQGLPEQRTSKYEYDSLNRLISKIAESVSTTQLKVTDSSKPYLKNKAVVADNIPSETYQYDAYGNQIAKIDANGAKTFTYFDKNDRKISEINALGLLTRFEYNASGQVTKIQSYETPVNVPTLPGGVLPNAPSGNVRVVQYSYDKLGRQISKITPDVYTYEYDLQGQGALVKKTTIEKTFYDGNGNIIRIEDAKGNISFYYYDKIGRKILTVDNEKYITQWIYSYNSSTKVNSQTEIKYANKLIQDITSSSGIEQVKALIVIDNANDRKTINTYDKKGRITQTEILNVKYSDGSTIKMASSTISYAYNGLDQVLTKIDSTGTVSTAYDKLGREILRTFGEYKDSNNITVKQRISSVYNGLGLLSSSAILGTNDAITTDDRVTQYSYDKLGRLIKELDVNLNHAVNYAYDLAGNQTWISTDRKTNTGVVKTDETLIEYNLLGKEITRRVNEGSRSSSESTAMSWKTLEERETRYNVFGEITGKRLVKFDSSTKSTDPWHEVTEYNNQGKVWKSNANNGVTRYYLYDSNGNATLQLDSTGSSSINAKTPDQLKDLTGVTYTETVYDKRNQVISVRQPKFSQESLDTTLNIFGQTISRTSDRSTVTLTDSTNKLKFDADTQKFNIQSNTLAKRLILKYWPKDSVATSDNTLIVDMQSGITAGAFILDVSAIKPNVEFNYSYSSSDIDGTVYETGVGVLKRIVNTVDIFTGGTVTADAEAKLSDIEAGTAMSSVAINMFNDYKIPITLIGKVGQKVVNYTDRSKSWITISYQQGISLDKIQVEIPPQLKNSENGLFEIELNIDGQTYKKNIDITLSKVEFNLDKNIDKFLGGTSYNIKIYKKLTSQISKIILDSTNKIDDKIEDAFGISPSWPNKHPMYYAQIGELVYAEPQLIEQMAILSSYNELMISNVPIGTSRVEVKYKPQGTSQWSTLTDNATLYKNIEGLYQINLNTLQLDSYYDYQYVTYNSKGDILGGGVGVINTTNNNAYIYQQKLPRYTDGIAISSVSIDIFNNYKLPITLVGRKAQKLTDYSDKSNNWVTFFYEEGIFLEKIKFSLPSGLKGFGNGEFEIELNIDGQVYKKNVGADSSLVEFLLDKNVDKFLGGKNYNIKIYKKISSTVTELIMNVTNTITDTIKTSFDTKPRWSEQPPLYYAEKGDVLVNESYSMDQEGVINSFNQLMINNVPTGTSRVEFKYKSQGVSQWSTLVDSATLYKNIIGWYQVDLSMLAKNQNYDYQYITYNAKGDVLGGGQGVINTANNQAIIDQRALFLDNISSIYNDKKEVVNSKHDIVKGIFSTSELFKTEVVNPYAPLNVPVVLRYTLDSEKLKKYGSDKFVLLMKTEDQQIIKREFIPSSSLTTSFDVDFTDFKFNFNVKNIVDIQVAVVDGQSLIPIGNGKFAFKIVYASPPGGPGNGPPFRGVAEVSGTLQLYSKSHLILKNQSPDTHMVTVYYRELGSNNKFEAQYTTKLIKDIYGQDINGNFELELLNIDSTKKYEFQYISFNKDYVIINRQQGVLEQNAQGVKVTTAPLNYGGNGFILFGKNTVEFVDQFGLKVNENANTFLKVRKVGSINWEKPIAYYRGTSDGNASIKNFLIWDYGTLIGDYEFKLEVFEDSNNTIPTQGIIGKLLLGDQPKVLSYIPKSFVQNQITFSGQPTGSKTVTVKYGTVAGQLNKTVDLIVGADGKAILDVTEIAEQNLFGTTTVYYSYETTDVNSKVLNRANGYINVGLAAGTGQHTNQLNDSWIDFQPAQNYGTKMEVYYRKRQVDKNGNFVSDLVNSDLSSDAYWGDKAQFEKVVLSRTNGLYRWNINNLVPQAGFENYEYFYQLYDQNNKFISFVPGKITVDNLGNGSIEQTKWVINGSGSNQNQIIRQQNYNAFGEIINEIDGNGNIITFSYNNLGKLTEKKLPNVNIRKADGTVVQGNPTLEYAYDLAGRLVSTKDANGNITKQTYLNGHNLETGDWLISNEIHADLGQVISSYDVFGNLKVRTNELGVKTAYDYDLNGYLVKTTRAARSVNSIGAKAISDTSGVQNALVDIYGYDELGNRIITTDALKNTITTEYDALGRIIENKTAEGAITKFDYIYDSNILNVNGSKGGIKRTETDGLGKKIIDDFDYYGRTIKHTDKGGHVFDYTYNAAGWLTWQTNSQGQKIFYSYYNNGLIKEIRDSSLNLSTVYRYDNNGNRIEERYQELNAKIGEPRIFQNALTTYDSLNRKIRVQDQAFNIYYEYDANGNIIHMLANYRDAVNAAPKIQDFWYSYDNMNRFTVSMGILNSTTKKVERGNTGVALSYDVLGQRLSADYGKDALNSTKAHKERYTYTTDGFLETIKNADYGTNGVLGTEYTLSSRHIDELGRVVKYEDYNENSNSIYQTTKNIYNKDDQLISQQKEGGSGAGTTVYSYLADKVTLDKTVMTPNSGSAQTTQFTYDWWDSAKQKNIKVTVGNLVGETTFSYDVNGHVSGFVDDKNAQNKRTATYVNNSQGMVLQRNELINGSMNRYRNFYYINGQRVGDVSNDGPSREDYVQSLQNSRGTPTQAKDFKPISSADFDQNFEAINAQYPSAAPTSYVVNNGDTLQSIALSVWGDASMWYMIADVNGLSPSDKLTAGQVLTIPNKVTNIHNNSETLRPYSPGEAIGDTQPTIPSPPPPPKPKKKCGGIAQIVMIVVAVVATVFTAGAALGVIAPGMGLFAGGLSVLAGTSGLGIIGSMAVAAGAAAVGSAASQLAGKAMGVVDSFSWSQVGVSALTAGATAGVGAGIGQLATKGYSWAQTASNAINAVNNGTASWTQAAGVGAYAGTVGYGSNYIANQVFGNNQNFSWAGLGSSIVGSMAGAGLGKSGAFNGFGKLASPYAYSVAGASAAATIEDKWFGGARPDYLNVSMAAIANTVGRQFGENAEDWLANSNTKSLSIYDENAFSFLPTEYSGQQPMYGDASRLNGSLPDTVKLQTIVTSASNSESVDDFEGMHLEIEKEAPKDLNIAYALGGVNSSYNMTGALARIEQKAMLQREADIAVAYNQRTWAERAESAKYSGGFFDTAKYVSQQIVLKVGDATSFGLLSRSDQRLLQVRQGQLSLSAMRNANMTEAGVGGAVTLATGGSFNTIRAVGGTALARIGVGETAQYYGGLAAAGAGSGILMDVGVQTSERISFGIGDGLTGRSEYDFSQMALSGAIGGIAAPAFGGVAAFAGSKYNVNVQSPLYFDTNAGRLNSGLPIKGRNPILPKRVFDPQGNPIPFGFNGYDDYVAFTDSLKAGLPENTTIIFKGSSVTGRSSPFSKTPNSPFDFGRVSDFDIALVHDDLYLNALELGRLNGFKVKSLPDRIGPLSNEQTELLGIYNLREKLSKQAGRPVEFMLYDNVQGALMRGNSHIVK